MTHFPSEQIPGVYHRGVGELIVTAISDGYADGMAMEAVRGISRDEIGAMMVAAQGTPNIRTSINTFVVRSERRTVLVDVGAGTTMGPTCGKLYANLAAAGIAPADVDAILLTHVHPDHSNGLTNEEGVGLFPRAEVILHEAELAHWFDDAAMAAATERARTRYFEGARFRLAPYRDRIRTFNTGEVLPGIAGVPCQGHTPGHAAYRISSTREEILIWGDTVHIPELQVPRPDITMQFDVDPALAVISRRAIFDLVLRDDLVVGGMHLNFPGFARMARTDGMYRLLPEPWAFTL